MRLCTASTVVTAETSLAIYMLGRSFPPSLIAETATGLLTTALSTVGPSVVSRYAMIAFSVSVLIFLRRRVKNSAGDKDAAALCASCGHVCRGEVLSRAGRHASLFFCFLRTLPLSISVLRRRWGRQLHSMRDPTCTVSLKWMGKFKPEIGVRNETDLWICCRIIAWPGQEHVHGTAIYCGGVARSDSWRVRGKDCWLWDQIASRCDDRYYRTLAGIWRRNYFR